MTDFQELYRSLVELSPEAILVVENARVLYSNPAAVRLFGPPAVPLEGKPIADLFDEASRVLVSDREPRAVREGPHQVDARIRRPDGRSADVEVTATALDDECRRTQMVVRDVSARKRMEATLRENEERLTLALAGAQEGVWDWNLETDAVVYSRRWKEMLGYEDEEIEPHVSAWERLLHPDDRARADALGESLARGAKKYEGEFRLRHKDGHYVPVLSRGYPVRRQPEGPVVRIVGTHFDLTELIQAATALQQSEERLRLAFAGAQEGVWDWNLETGAVVYSHRWKEMLGYEDHEIAPHVSEWERLLHPDDRPRAQELNESLARGADTYEGEFRLRHKDGHYIDVLSRGFPMRREPGGPVVRIVGTHFDLTERKHREAERARAELLARLVFAQEDERRRIAREMHDQFGELLTALERGIDDLGKACADQPGLRQRVEKLQAVARQLDRDVDQLVWELRPTALDDLGLRAALANYVQDWSKRVGIAAELHTSGLVDERLPSDIETTLYRIAQEALTNVAKHSRAHKVEVILERREGQVCLVLEDDGVGFETGTKGKGFGLIGMHERAALVGATLEIESTSGEGTTVLLRMTAPAVIAATEP